MREYFDDFDDIELDDNEIVDRLMREWEMEERRRVKGARRAPARALMPLVEEDLDDDLDEDSGGFDDFEDDGADAYDDDY